MFSYSCTNDRTLGTVLAIINFGNANTELSHVVSQIWEHNDIGLTIGWKKQK